MTLSPDIPVNVRLVTQVNIEIFSTFLHHSIDLHQEDFASTTLK